MKRNANHIIPLCCHLPVSCRGQVDGCALLGILSHIHLFIYFKETKQYMEIIGNMKYNRRTTNKDIRF